MGYIKGGNPLFTSNMAPWESKTKLANIFKTYIIQDF